MSSPLNKRQTTPHKRKVPLLMTFWRQFCVIRGLDCDKTVWDCAFWDV